MAQQRKSIRKAFVQAKEEHERMIAYIKLLIIGGLIVMAALVRYTGFIKEHWDLFILEIITYLSSTVVACVFLYYLRNQEFISLDFFKFIIIMLVFTLIVVVCAEVSGLNTKFVSDNEDGGTPRPMNEYRREAIRFKKELLERMIITINIVFLFAFTMMHLVKNDRTSFIILLAGVVVAMVSIVATQTKELEKYLKENRWLEEGSTLSASQLGMSVFFTLIFTIFTIIVLISSLFRYDSFKIYSYFPDNDKMCGMKRQIATIFLFASESLITAAIIAVPIFYVASNRNKPELGKNYKLIKEKEVFIDFGLLTFKIFIFLVALQMTGLYDKYNLGFCRENGCNVRLQDKNAICVPN